MATTYSTDLGIKKIGTGLEAGTWGASTSQNFERLSDALKSLKTTTQWALAQDDRNSVLASAYHYLMLSGDVIGGWLLTRGLVNASEASVSESDLQVRKTITRYHCEQFLTHASGLAATIEQGDGTIMALGIDQF